MGIKKNIAVLEGDGVGPEVTKQAVKVLMAIADEFAHEFIFINGLIGASAIDETGVPLPQQTIDTCLDSDAILFGAVGHPKYDNNASLKIRPELGLLQLRKAMQLFASIRPITTFSALHHLSPLKTKNIQGVDFIIFREINSGIYFGKKETSVENDFAIDECTYHKDEIERIAHLAFQSAQKRKNKLTLVDKSNVLETSRLWRKVVKDLAGSYPDVLLDFLNIDNAAIQIIQNPKQFDVLLTENMFGDILSSEASVICGSLGLLPSASIGNKTPLFEPIHGSFPKVTGKDIANPIGAILSVAMMLDYFNLKKEADLIKEAVSWTLINQFVTKDIEPINFYFTSTIGELICDYIGNKIPGRLNKENIELRKSTII